MNSQKTNPGNKIKLFFKKLENRNETYWFEWIIILITGLLTILLIGLFFWDLLKALHHGGLLSRWNDIWTWAGTLAIPIALLTYWLTNKREDRKKAELISDAEIPKFLELYDRSELLRNDREKAENESGEDSYEALYFRALRSGQTILRKMYRIYILSSPEEFLEEGKYKNEKENINLVVFIMDQLIHHSDVKRDKTSDITNDSIITFMIDTFANNDLDDGSDPKNNSGSISKDDLKIKPDEILIVRTVPTSSWPDFLGDWRISFKKAEKINYLIGVSGYVNSKKTYRDILHVKDRDEIGSRVRFNGNFITKHETKNRPKHIKTIEDPTAVDNIKETLKYLLNEQNKSLDPDESESLENQISKLLEDWKGINPAVYLNNFEK